MKSTSAQWKPIVWVIVIQISIAIFYSGNHFIHNISTAVPSSPVDDSTQFMEPGDHFEQFYRYSLVTQNIKRKHFPYYSGYQYNISSKSNPFSEGLIFFPFTLINSFIAIFAGDILAYNLMAILSYVLVGLSAYGLILYMTKSVMAATISSIYLSTVPFRTSFLYGEMVYGIDLCLIPLPILFTELAIRTNRVKYFILFGASLFLIATSNFQSFYWLVFLICPYFVFRYSSYLISNEKSFKSKLIRIGGMIPGIIACAIYLLLILRLINESGLHKGQNFNELLVYTPSLLDIFRTFNGNEKNVYLGWTLLFVIPTIFIGLRKKDLMTVRDKKYLYVFFPLFLISYMFCFGPNIDKSIGLGIYKWMFDYIPGFNGTRTTGRIMVVVVLCYTIVLGITVGMIDRKLNTFSWKKVAILFGSVFILLIVYDFNYLKPGMVILQKENKAYDLISNSDKRILGLPFQYNAAHFYNASFMYYALKYNLLMYNGHSSIYPKEYNRVTPFLYSINAGDLNQEQWEWLKINNFKYIVAHNTEYEPRLDTYIIAKLMESSYLNFESKDNDVYLFDVREKKKIMKYSKNAIDAFYDRLMSLGGNRDEIRILYYSGWYYREEYPNYKAFRWMNGKQSSVIVMLNELQSIGAMKLLFSYKNPIEDLEIRVTGATATKNIRRDLNGWKEVELTFTEVKKKYLYIEFFTPVIYSVQFDNRKFGCMVSDIILR